MRQPAHAADPPPMIDAAPIGLALVEPDQPGNFGAALRLAACLGVPVEVVEPTGFPLDQRRIARAAMDYADHVAFRRHATVPAFLGCMAGEGRRLVLLSARGETAYHHFTFEAGDVLAVGSESRGAPPALTAEVAARVRIPMRPGLRSFNVVTAAAIGLAEALRQLEALPGVVADTDERQEKVIEEHAGRNIRGRQA